MILKHFPIIITMKTTPQNKHIRMKIIIHIILSIGFTLYLSGWNNLRMLSNASAQPPASTPQAQDEFFFVQSPYKALAKTRQFIDIVVLRALVPMGYIEQQAADENWKTKDNPNVRVSRYFTKQLPDGAIQTVELAVSIYPQGPEEDNNLKVNSGRYEIYVYGVTIDKNGQRYLNSELPNLYKSMKALVEEVRMEQIGYEVYQLSHIQSNRALALLKALGYTTIEYKTQSPGKTSDENIYDVIRQEGVVKMPVIIKFLDAPHPPPPLDPQQKVDPKQLIAMDLVTMGDPQQRLLIVYYKDDIDALQTLVNLLQEEIDRPAKQVVIEAMVIEVNTDGKSQLGLSFTADKGKYQILAQQPVSGTDSIKPFTFAFDKEAAEAILSFKSLLEALVETGKAQILSNPSVLVLDGRQANIRVGQDIPTVKTNATAEGIIRSVDYLTVGISLNLRPRISQDNATITMQVGTDVSATAELRGASDVFFAPTIDTRSVQTVVRVANNTPFIIGGLIATTLKERTVGIPVLSQIPLLGNLFRRTKTDNVQKEVIVVLTPRVIPKEDIRLSYVIPKDDKMFDSFGYRLFRNAYRVRSDEVFDLKFIYESNSYKELVNAVQVAVEKSPGVQRDERINSILKGSVPGEEVLVRRMLWEIIVRKLNYNKYVNPEKIIFFEEAPGDVGSASVSYFGEKFPLLNQGQTLALIFDVNKPEIPERLFVQPKATVLQEDLGAEKYIQRLIRYNPRRQDGTPGKWTILLIKKQDGDASIPWTPTFEILRGVLVLKQILELNRDTLPLTIRDFKPGVQIVFPTGENLLARHHIIDHKVAQLFYEVIRYYPAFEDSFKYEVERIYDRLKNTPEEE